MNTFEECSNKGKVRVSPESKNWVGKEIIISQKNIDSAQKVFKIEEFEATLIMAYNSVLHSNYALVYSKGFVVKGHLCLIKTVEHLFSDVPEIMEFMSVIQRSLETRNLTQYEGYSIDKEQAEFLIDLAKDYLIVVKKQCDFQEK